MNESDWLRAVGLSVLMARTHARKTQGQLGVSPTTVAKLEDGGGGNLRSIEKIAKALKLQTPTDLLTYPVQSEGEHAFFLKEVARMFSDPTRRRLLHVIGGVKDEELKEFEDYLDAFKATRKQPRDRLQRPRRR